MSENVKVEVIVSGDDDSFYLKTLLNGTQIDCVIHVDSIEEGEAMSAQIHPLLRIIDWRGYWRGHRDAQLAMQKSMGIYR